MYSSHSLWCCQPPPGCSHLPTLTTKLRLWQKGSGGSKRSGGFIKALAACDDSSLRLLSTASVVTHWGCSLASCLLIEDNSGLAQVGTHRTRLSFLSPAPANKTSVPSYFCVHRCPPLEIRRVRCADLVDIWRELKAKKNSAFLVLASWM